jgi:hypothetical protein
VIGVVVDHIIAALARQQLMTTAGMALLAAALAARSSPLPLASVLKAGTIAGGGIAGIPAPLLFEPGDFSGQGGELLAQLFVLLLESLQGKHHLLNPRMSPIPDLLGQTSRGNSHLARYHAENQAPIGLASSPVLSGEALHPVNTYALNAKTKRALHCILSSSVSSNS